MSAGSMWPASSRMGTVSVNRSVPRSRITSVTAWPDAEFAELRDTALVQIGLFDDLWSTRVSDVERQSGHQEACLPGAGLGDHGNDS